MITTTKTSTGPHAARGLDIAVLKYRIYSCVQFSENRAGE